MKLIGLTGGIGAGKSTVTDYLRDKGYPVLDADQIAKELLQPGMDTLEVLKQEFGEEILKEDGSLDRKKMAEIAFSDPLQKAKLDRITHKKVIDVIRLRAETFPENAIVFIDAPLLFEAGIDQFTSENWVIDAEEETRIARVTARDPITREEVIQRINNQMDRCERLQKADFILDNSGSKLELYRQVNDLLNHLQE